MKKRVIGVILIIMSLVVFAISSYKQPDNITGFAINGSDIKPMLNLIVMTASFLVLIGAIVFLKKQHSKLNGPHFDKRMDRGLIKIDPF